MYISSNIMKGVLLKSKEVFTYIYVYVIQVCYRYMYMLNIHIQICIFNFAHWPIT